MTGGPQVDLVFGKGGHSEDLFSELVLCQNVQFVINLNDRLRTNHSVC